jgi:radical SAM superfamily enzyme YgiQ (UPF0313 family)
MADAKVSFETLKKMQKSGCIGLKFGVESASKIILKNIRKKITLDDVKEVVKNCKKLGIFTHATYMFGLPGETKETIEKTINFSSKLMTDTAQFSVVTPYPGTDFYKMCLKNDWLKVKDWTKFDGSYHSVIEYPHLSKETIENAILKAKKKLFLNILFRNPRVLKRYIENTYKQGGFTNILKNVFNKTKFLIRSY